MAERPGWLSDEARAVWDALPADVVAKADRDALVVYCNAVADFTRAQQVLDQTGVVVKGARGGLVRSPLNIVKAENAAIMRALARDLGLVRPDPDAPALRANARYRNAAALERTITALRSGGRLEDADAATAALARHLAAALDAVDAEAFPTQTASLARAQLATLRMLRGERDDDHAPADIDALIAALVSAPLGDASEP
jgi:P27 family predicted phage terminase small subunit